MKLSTRLLLPLIGAITAVMTGFAVWAQVQRESSMVAEARRETEAYATALALALEETFRDPELTQVQEIIDRLSRERTIYAILVYDPDGSVRFTSESLQRNDAAPDSMVQRALVTGGPVSFERSIDDQDVFSVLRGFRGGSGEIDGAFEVTQPLSYVHAENARTRQRFLLNWLTLVAAVAGLTWWLVRRLVARPLERFANAAQVLGTGDLSYRVDPATSRGELAEVAHRLNQMADHLETAGRELLEESEERIALERALRASERMAAVGNLAARIGHEIAAPLQVIRGRADLLLKGDKGPEDRKRQLRIIVEQIDRITLIVRNLLGFSRRPQPRIRPLDLAELLESVLEFLEPEFERTKVRLQRDTDGRLDVMGDPDLLHQVFINLILNALQALDGWPRDRTLTIGVRKGGDESTGHVTVFIEDSGPGIDSDSLPMIFEPFFSTKSGAAGTGLGLAVARTAVEEMGGTIEAQNIAPFGPERGAESPPVSGARFILTLPAAQEMVSHG